MRKLLTTVVVALAAIGLVSMVTAADPKTIKEIMKEAHTPMGKSLMDKVASGKGDKEDAEKLVALYKDLLEGMPKKGDKEKWKAKVEGVVKAAEAVVNGEAKAGPALKKAANCGACHSIYK